MPKLPGLSQRDAVCGFHPILNIPPIAYLAAMKNHKIVTCVAMSALALSFLLVGCDRQVSSETKSSVSGGGLALYLPMLACRAEVKRRLVRKSFSSRAKARSKAVGCFQFEKSGR